MKSSTASTDFGLYKENTKSINPLSMKFVVIVFGIILVLLVVIYVVVAALYKAPIEIEDIKDSKTEELIFEQNLRPKPFSTVFTGPIPQEFTTSTEKPTTLKYPQLTNYRHKYYPRNIQEIIDYMGKPKIKPEYDSAEDILKPNYSTSEQNLEHDPFHSFKPNDPGDINLLATASFRFASPFWSSIKQMLPKYYNSHIPQMTEAIPQQIDSGNIRETTLRAPKPIVVTLNIYPMESDLLPFTVSRYGQKHLPKLQGINPRKAGQRGNKFRLNVFPDNVSTEVEKRSKT